MSKMSYYILDLVMIADNISQRSTRICPRTEVTDTTCNLGLIVPREEYSSQSLPKFCYHWHICMYVCMYISQE